MKKLAKIVIREAKAGLGQLIFPNVCVCCGRENTQEQRQLCSFCLEDRFEDANPENNPASGDILLPEGVVAQHALWKFDKGGDLQQLLHQLKYERLTKIGVDLGCKLGYRVQAHPQLQALLIHEEAILVPVPLHYLKYRYRGFNQAFMIARGFQQVWHEISICRSKDVNRAKNTRSQTGFSLEKRLENMQGAFRVTNKEAVAQRVAVIIDDVFTTGATTFELAQSLLQAEATSVVILTIAQA